MNVIFLDIDGVLNSEEFERKNPNVPRARSICKKAVKRLNWLCNAGDAVVVISSSWRKLFDLRSIYSVLRDHGFTGLIVGKTPDFARRSRAEFEELYRRAGNFERGHEIVEWIRAWPLDGPTDPDRVEHFVVLDDGDDMTEVREHHVHINPAVGLQWADCYNARTVLRGPK